MAVSGSSVSTAINSASTTGAVGVFLQNLHERVLHGGIGEHRAVMEGDAGLLLAGNLRAVCHHVPRIRQIGLWLVVPVMGNQTLADLRRDHRNSTGRNSVVRKGGWLGTNDHHHRAITYGLGCGPCRSKRCKAQLNCQCGAAGNHGRREIGIDTGSK